MATPSLGARDRYNLFRDLSALREVLNSNGNPIDWNIAGLLMTFDPAAVVTVIWGLSPIHHAPLDSHALFRTKVSPPPLPRCQQDDHAPLQFIDVCALTSSRRNQTKTKIKETFVRSKSKAATICSFFFFSKIWFLGGTALPWSISYTIPACMVWKSM